MPAAHEGKVGQTVSHHPNPGSSHYCYHWPRDAKTLAKRCQDIGQEMPRHWPRDAKTLAKRCQTLAKRCQDIGQEMPRHWPRDAKTLAKRCQDIGQEMPRHWPRDARHWPRDAKTLASPLPAHVDHTSPSSNHPSRRNRYAVEQSRSKGGGGVNCSESF